MACARAVVILGWSVIVGLSVAVLVEIGVGRSADYPTECELRRLSGGGCESDPSVDIEFFGTCGRGDSGLLELLGGDEVGE